MTAKNIFLTSSTPPGHVDFNYEVSRSLAACEGAILVVDASQGIEAQTLANTYLAVDSGLEIVPVVNKIDLPSADPDRVIQEIEDVIGIPAEDAPKISAKAGINIHAVLEKVVHDIPAPTGDINAPLRALIFDSYYDSYKGVIIYVRLKEGQIHPGDEFKLMATGSVFNVVECGLMHATAPRKDRRSLCRRGWLHHGFNQDSCRRKGWRHGYTHIKSRRRTAPRLP